jgi:transposase-like protein
MYYDVECPYCNRGQEINHDDGYGYSEEETHQQRCNHCDRVFVYTTSISFYYEADIAPCLNKESDHHWKPIVIAPKRYTRMRCTHCDKERELTPEERIELKVDKD